MSDDLTLVEPGPNPCSGCGSDLSVDEHFEGCAHVTAPPCTECGSDEDEHYPGCIYLDMTFEPEPDPVEIAEADGSWIFVPNGQLPDEADAVGMRAHRVHTRCRWTHRHIAEDQPIPQPCCFSVLVTTSRLDGPVQIERAWLSMDNHPEAASQLVNRPAITEGTAP